MLFVTQMRAIGQAFPLVACDLNLTAPRGCPAGNKALRALAKTFE